MSWHFIPWSLQYLCAFVIIISLSVYVLYRSPRNVSSRFFFMFGLCFSLWQIAIFLHRNAPSHTSSQYFFAAGIFASLLGGSFLPLTIISIVRYRPSYLLLTAPAAAGGIYNLIVLPFDTIWNPSFGWSYISRMDHDLIIGISAIFYAIFLLYFVLYIWQRYPALRKKISLIIVTFFIMNGILMMLSNIWLSRHPGAPPFGGIINLLSFIIVTYGILLSPTHTISIKGATRVTETYAAFLEDVYRELPGKELGTCVVQFRDMLDAMGLKEIVTMDRGGAIIIDSDAFSYETIGACADTLIRGARVLSLEPPVLEWIPRILNISYSEMKKIDTEGAVQWGAMLLQDHGAYLNRWELMDSIHFAQGLPEILHELAGKQQMLITSDNPQILLSSVKDLSSWGYHPLLITKYLPDGNSILSGLSPHTVIRVRKATHRAKERAISLIEELQEEITRAMQGDGTLLLILDCLDSLIFSEGKPSTLSFLQYLMNCPLYLVCVVNPHIVGADTEDIALLLEGSA
ncbi:MAG: hypothetical protein HXS47_10520 [Theionarchaea archaeon]|nr:hypothetical protein [Theionarchaea archaeon]